MKCRRLRGQGGALLSSGEARAGCSAAMGVFREATTKIARCFLCPVFETGILKIFDGHFVQLPNVEGGEVLTNHWENPVFHEFSQLLLSIGTI